MRSSLVLLSWSLLAMTACGGAVETQQERGSEAGDAALGLWIAPTSDDVGFRALDVCADGTVSYELPADPAGVRSRCAAVGGSHETDGARVDLVVGPSHIEAKIAGGALVMASPDGERVYYRTSRAGDITGSYAIRTVLSPDEGGGAVTVERRFRFGGGHFEFENVLAREGTKERWTTTERGSYAMAGPGEVVLTPEGQASHVEHAIVFGPGGEHLHVGRVGYMTRVDGR